MSEQLTEQDMDDLFDLPGFERVNFTYEPKFLNTKQKALFDCVQKIIARRFSEKADRCHELQVILDLMGIEPYLVKGHYVKEGEFMWTIVADKVSVTDELISLRRK